jgi:hypothetical protein
MTAMAMQTAMTMIVQRGCFVESAKRTTVIRPKQMVLVASKDVTTHRKDVALVVEGVTSRTLLLYHLERT